MLKIFVLEDEWIQPVSYTHLDVYKRQVESSPKNVSKEVLEKLDYLIGNALRDQDVENRLPQIQREIESSLQVGV